MSKINQEFMKKTIKEMMATRKPRGFEESIELQINLRDYDPEKEKRFSGAIKLPHVPHPHIKICVIGTAVHCDQAKALGIGSIDVEGLKKFNKERVPIKKWAKPFDILIASESLMRQIPKLLGNILNKINKFPIVIGDSEDVSSKLKEVKGTVRFQLKKVLCLATAIGTDKLTEDQIRQNLNTSINFLISLLKKGWQNIATLYVKTSMSKAYRIFG